MWLCILPGSFFKLSSLLPRLLKVACTLAFLKSLVLKNEQRSAHRWCFLALLLPSADPSLSTWDPVESGDAVGRMWCRGVPCSARQGLTRKGIGAQAGSWGKRHKWAVLCATELSVLSHCVLKAVWKGKYLAHGFFLVIPMIYCWKMLSQCVLTF